MKYSLLKKLPALFIMMLVCTHINAVDIRKLVKNTEDVESAPYYIDPDKHVFGITFGSSEDDVIQKLGAPDGYYRFNENVSGMIYDDNKVYLFKNNKFYAFRFNGGILDWKLSEFAAKGTGRSHYHTAIPWAVSPGIENDMNLPEIKRILGDRLIQGDRKYEASYETEHAIVELSLSRRSGFEGDSAYSAHALFISTK